jgi:cytoskeletal protein RodZ
MSSFGEDLRMERMSRGIALEDITAVTKISRHHLLALEQERFRQLPGGILNKGIIRGYANAVGLDQQDWTDRFMKAWQASGQADENDWTTFASNVGKARLQQREAAEFRIKWVGVLVLLAIVALFGFIVIRFYGLKAGWWPTLIPSNHVGPSVHAWYDSARTWVGKFLA